MYQKYQDPLKGNGIITLRKIKKGEFICWYEGNLIRPKNIKKKEKIIKLRTSGYDFESEYGIVLVDKPYHMSHYMNDALNPNGIVESIKSFNVKFDLRKRFDSIFYYGYYWPCFIAIRDIEPGEPLETFYGQGYWSNNLVTNMYNENLIKMFAQYTGEFS